MNEIIIDFNTFNHLKVNIGCNLTGTGYEKPNQYLFPSYMVAAKLQDPNNQDHIKEEQLKSEGKIKIKTTLSAEEYKNFLEETYQKLKFKKKFDEKHITKHPNAAIYLYHIDDKIVPRTNEEIEKAKRDKEEYGLGTDTLFSDLSHNNNNQTQFDITIENNEIYFRTRRGYEAPDIMNFGNIELSAFTSKSISHINIKQLPFKFKESLDIHPAIYKKTQNKELIEAQIFKLIKYYSHLVKGHHNEFKEGSIFWDKNNKDYLKYLEIGNKLLPKVKEIHGFEETALFGSFSDFLDEINYRISLEALNEYLVMMEVYIKSIDSLRSKEERDKYSKEELQEYNDFITKYKAVEEILPSFPITIFVQKRRVEIMKKSHPHLFDTGKESLSYFE